MYQQKPLLLKISDDKLITVSKSLQQKLELGFKNLDSNNIDNEVMNLNSAPCSST